MGQGAFAGIPLQLAGTRKILEFMDWGDYGAKGTFINIGAVGLLPTYSMLQIVSIIK
jgi:adenylate kinase